MNVDRLYVRGRGIQRILGELIDGSLHNFM